MILWISGVVVVVGLVCLCSGLLSSISDLIGTGVLIVLVGVLLGFFLAATVICVKTEKTVIPSKIEVTQYTAVVMYGETNTESLVTHDIRIIKNPEKYAVQKSADYNSYGFVIGNSVGYSIVEKHGN